MHFKRVRNRQSYTLKVASRSPASRLVLHLAEGGCNAVSGQYSELYREPLRLGDRRCTRGDVAIKLNGAESHQWSG